MLALLRINGFIAFLAVAFINAFVDLGHKIIVQNTLFKAHDGPEQVMLTAVVNALILLPFIGLLTPAGYLSDRFAKPLVMRWAARSAVAITLLITLSYYQGWFELAFGMTFVLALQSALYSPAKYGFIRDLVGTDNISEGNSWMQSVTMVAILLGIVSFSLLFETLFAAWLPATGTWETAAILQAIAPLGWLLVGGALLEAWLAQRLPMRKQPNSAEPFNWAAYRRGQLLKKNLRYVTSSKAILRSVLGLASFWTISQIMLAIFPSYAEVALGASNTFHIQGAMALAGVGIMLGSVLAGRLSAHHINTGLIPAGALGLLVGLVLLPQAGSLLEAGGYFLLIGLSGALMTIPLNALIQFHAPQQKLGKVLAGNNFLQNIAMLTGLVLTAIFSLLEMPASWLLIMLIGIAALVFLVALWLLPEAFIRILVAALMRQRYRLTVQGFHNLKPEGEGMLLLGNHISWLDWAMIQMACPRPIRFVMERSIYERWYLRWFLDLFGVIPISKGKGSRTSLEQVQALLKAGEVVCLFPEGAISYTGQLGQFRRGFERAVADTGVAIVPFYLRGLWGSRWSRAEDTLQADQRTGWKRDVIVAFGAPLSADAKAEDVKQAVAHLAVVAWQAYIEKQPAIPELFIKNMKRWRGVVARFDQGAKPLNAYQQLAAALVLAQYVRRLDGDRIAIVLPAGVSAALANMAALLAGKVVANLNPTADLDELKKQITVSGAEGVITSDYTLKLLGLNAVQLNALPVVALESVRDQAGWLGRSIGMLGAALLPTKLLVRWFGSATDTQALAAITLTQRADGQWRSIGLSQQNIVANVRQLFDLLNRREDERLAGVLPFSTAYGLLTHLFLPWLEPLSVVYQTKSHESLAIAKTIARHRASLFFMTPDITKALLGTEAVHPAMLSSLRLVVCGGGKLDGAAQDAFLARFHKPVLEGFGCAEVAAVATVNIPDYLSTRWWSVQRGTLVGSVGMALPGTAVRIEKPDGQLALPEEVGEIIVGGAQVSPYCNADDAIFIEQGVRWFRTRRAGYLDADGFLFLDDSQS
ncbi:MFS transporter [Neptunomonas marina]|uniref:MFS transporter n=1 Tax=Neptunomonas marina TaxID=1815562 RepID=A0A437Q7N7_9GAMM|nr:MFS transporter [Neptunomonas marina]RVU30554.1 MFS transporter [Neptunomonas marina]